jgi:hypothetical protein
LEVDAYIRKGEEESAKIRAEIEARQPMIDLRERLLARWRENN